MKKFSYTFIVVLLIQSGCGKTNSNEFTETASVDQIVDTKAEISKNERTTVNEEVLPERDTTILPGQNNYISKVITTGQFHDNEVWEGVEKEKWLGLFNKSGQFYILPTTIRAERVNDPIAGSETDLTGWLITTADKDTSLLLFSGLDFVENRKVESINFPRQEIYPGDTVKFEFVGSTYEFFATGAKYNLNYKLYMTIETRDSKTTQLLVAQPAFDDEMINIIFAGDIDGDEILDLIIDTSNHYNRTSPTLYLSKPHDSGQILKVAGIHTSVGC